MDGVLRVISGLEVGACFVLGERTRLGRAVDADIQLCETHVSRHHARIRRLAGGDYELADLGSKIGTLVNGTRVERHRLAPNDIIAIGRCMFSFELSVGEVTAKGFELKTRGFDALRPTQPLPTIPEQRRTRPAVGRPRRRTTQRRMRAMDGAGPVMVAEVSFGQAPGAAPPAQSSEDPLLAALEGPKLDTILSQTQRQVAPQIDRPGRAERAERPTPKLVPRVDSGPLGVDPEARESALAVLRDVLDYRALRLDELRGAALADDAYRRYQRLTTRLLVDTFELPASRRFVRVPCVLPASLTQRDHHISRTLEVKLEDLSAGGARLVMHDPGVRVGDEVWLAFDLTALFSYGQKVVFRSRVVWTSPRIRATGLMFGGNAKFVDSIDAAVSGR